MQPASMLMANALAWTARGLAIAVACIDPETWTVPINVVAQPPVTITSVVPPAGITISGKKVTIPDTNFQSGATITFGGSQR